MAPVQSSLASPLSLVAINTTSFLKEVSCQDSKQYHTVKLYLTGAAELAARGRASLNSARNAPLAWALVYSITTKGPPVIFNSTPQLALRGYGPDADTPLRRPSRLQLPTPPESSTLPTRLDYEAPTTTKSFCSQGIHVEPADPHETHTFGGRVLMRCEPRKPKYGLIVTHTKPCTLSKRYLPNCCVLYPPSCYKLRTLRK